MSFKEWLYVNYPEIKVREMATLNFGRKHKGKHHTKVPPDYLQWMLDQMNAGKGRFNVTDDQGQQMSPPDLSNMLQNYLGSGKPAQQLQQTQRSRAAANEPPKGMQQVPRPAGWRGPFAAKFDDKNGKFSKGDMIYWNGKRGEEGMNLPAFIPEGEIGRASCRERV